MIGWNFDWIYSSVGYVRRNRTMKPFLAPSLATLLVATPVAYGVVNFSETFQTPVVTGQSLFLLQPSKRQTVAS